MFAILSNRTFALLFSAQVIALLGTGLLTVALGLLAYDLAEGRAGAVLGTALAIKMVAYVGLSPIAHALAERLPRRAVLVGADLVRAGVALCLPFVTEVWQIYLLVFLLQSASATFTPAFQATIPDVLPEEEDYTRALALSRLAYDLENLASPVLAGLLLTVLSYNWLFLGTVLGFAGSALLVFRAAPPPVIHRKALAPFLQRVTRGARIYLATPRLRGLLALNLAAAAPGAFVLVNTVVLVRDGYGGAETALAVALAAFGAGSIALALSMERLLAWLGERRLMIAGATASAVLALGLCAMQVLAGWPAWRAFLAFWAVAGFCMSAVMTPAGRLLRRSAHPEDRPAVFAAHFALSHLCWLLTYPLAGWAGATLGLGATLGILGGLGLISVLVARSLWPAYLPDAPAHVHPDLPPDHPHLREHGHAPGKRHAHVFVIDDEHRVWPTQG